MTIKELPTTSSCCTLSVSSSRSWCWLLAGMLAGVVTAFAAWWLQVPIYESTTLIYIGRQQPVILQEISGQHPSDQLSFDTFRRLQCHVATCDLVLKNALRQVDNLLPTVADPLKWMKNHISVTTSPDSEIMELKLRATDAYPNHLEIVLNAVQKSYLEEFTNLDKQQKENHIRELQRHLYRIEEEFRSKKNELDNSIELSRKYSRDENFVPEKIYDIQVRQRANERRQTWIDKLAAEIQAATIEQSAPSRIRLLARAEYGREINAEIRPWITAGAGLLPFLVSIVFAARTRSSR